MAKVLVGKTLIPIEYCIEVEDDFDETHQESVNDLFHPAIEEEFSTGKVTEGVIITKVIPGTYEDYIARES